jgi:phosphoadenosine phosphosulfate reductase
MNHINQIESLIEGKSAEELLRLIAVLPSEKVVFSTSLSYEDQVITHYIFSNNLDIKVFTLDTGRLFPQTYDVLSATLKRYGREIKIYAPQTSQVEELVTSRGPFSFYESVEARKECCHIRKVEPLQRALQNSTIWITGIRAEHSEGRHNMSRVEWDEKNQLVKIHPLLYWSLDEVREAIRQAKIPYNILHDQGFVSIGCQPCTRAIRSGEDFRAGRWWWENSSSKECGLHR